MFNNRSKNYFILQNSSSLQFLKCRAKYQMVSVMINDKPNLNFNLQYALILQLQAFFEYTGSSEQVGIIH